VTAANETFGAFASEDENLKATVSELPATLRQASSTLRDVRPFADELGPATTALTPALQALERSNARVRPAARELTPIIRDQIRPFVRSSRPLVRDLAPAARDLSELAPELRRDVRVLNRLFNLLAFNQNGREAPDKEGRDEGYLYWLAWAAHNSANLINTDDANGPMRGIFLTGTCTTLQTLVTNEPELGVRDGAVPGAGGGLRQPAHHVDERREGPGADACRRKGPSGRRRRRLMQKTPFSFGRLATISLFTLSCFGLLCFLWLAFGGSVPLQPKGYRVQVSFDDAQQLADQADVRVAGVPVGKVVGKELDPKGNRTIAKLEIKPEYAPLRRDARAILRQKTLLGETYVEMTLGSKRAGTIPEDGRLDDAQVAEAVDFDELLDTFDAPTRKVFQQWQRTAADSAEGRSQDINDALGNFPTFVGSAQSVVDTLGKRREALGALVRETGQTFEAITRNEGALSDLVTDQATVFRTLSDRRERIAETFVAFPTFLRESRATLRRLSRFSRDTTPLIEDLEPVLGDVGPTLTSLQGLSPDLQKLFTDLRPLIAAGRTGFPALSRVLRGLDPTLASTGPFLQQLNPILEYLEYQQPTVSDFLSVPPSAFGLKLSPRNESLGHALPQVIVTGSQTLPQQVRTADNRGNAYLPPGGAGDPRMKDPSKFALPSFDCGNSGEKEPTNTPGCFTSRPQEFQGKTQKFPQVEASNPGGESKQAGR
jgi:virulence factor Mce-like protein